ncbi:NmrA family NAD(P)-binding protein [uncultured Chitinophaga sp.]|jgi:NmrA-like family.|uniref:NmrA family NAD(P)-binding protein n=1 Tax=uncultured Chitinophaga sp. TaxID=339340 RepID=UPI002620A67C|nr:NmrA family NAD(P)-binding protein [uncultured Chitinophaga sp.]
MKIIVTGSLGNISKPLTQTLVKQGHSVTVISSSPEKQQAIRDLGAQAAIGSVEDTAFLSKTFTGADAVYCMNPPRFSVADQISYYQHIGSCYAEAIAQSGIKRVIYLSSYGAHLPSGTGFISGSYKTEQLLNSIANIHLTHVRPGYFYYNLFNLVGMIKTAGFIGNVYGGEDKLALVSPTDIAAAVAEEITDVKSTKKVRYVFSDYRTCNEVAAVLGKAINLPELKWLVLPKEQVLQSLVARGMPLNAAENLVELGLAIHSGIMLEGTAVPEHISGKVSLEDFATTFAKVFNQEEKS